MMKDPIVEEAREAGNAYAKSLGYDLDRIVEDLRQRQRRHPERIVSFAKDTPAPAAEKISGAPARRAK